MANTTFDRGSNHPNLAVAKWSRQMFKQALADNPFKAYMGPGDENIIQVNKDFTKEAGDKITFALRALDNSDGQGDDGEYEGTEAAMVFYDMPVLIHERGHSIRLNGKMTEQRTIIDLRGQAKMSLGEWYSRILANDIVCSLSGLKSKKLAGPQRGANAQASGSVDIETVNQTPMVSGDAIRHFFGGGTGSTVNSVADDELITTATTAHMTTQVISFVKRMAARYVDMTSYDTGALYSPIRPVMVNGKPWYVLFLHELQIKDLRQDSAWLQAQREANVRGNENPIFSGAEGIWDGVIIKKCDYIQSRYGDATGTDSSTYFDATTDPCASSVYVARGLLCGAQAAVLAFGQNPSWNEKFFEYGTRFGVHTDAIYGIKKTLYNSVEFGCMTVDTGVTLDS